MDEGERVVELVVNGQFHSKRSVCIEVGQTEKVQRPHEANAVEFLQAQACGGGCVMVARLRCDDDDVLVKLVIL